MRAIIILKGGWKDCGRLIRRTVHCGMSHIEVVGMNLVVTHLPHFTHVSPYNYPLSEVLHYRMEPELDKSDGRSSRSQSGYDILGYDF